MNPSTLIAFLGKIEQLKSGTRHSWTQEGTHETVAAHSWRLATMALLMRGEMPGVDMDRVIAMCLVHDFGEAITGDIPAFEKSDAHEDTEARAVGALLADLPQPLQGDLQGLFAEMAAMETPEAKAFKALDKMEAVLQHNESDLSHWLPLEYELQQTYGTEETAAFPYLKAFRAQLLKDTRAKIGKDGQPLS